MRVPNPNNVSPVGANMTPMIDVVFLLIIFFLVSSHLARQENYLPVDLPIASTFLPASPDRVALTVTVDAESNYRISGDIIAADQLQAILLDHVGRSGANASLRLRTDGSVVYQYIEPILREAALVGIHDVTISVREANQ
ncbi:biopolymer transport protein ExbD [Novipirellula galeiformis]|uniref:Biopolymer transport protein ExbD n=1 Tax=Novipirellula galeiformis TaxID=2528004 RepID=A0A5C6CGW7_9BACT|nr:biopolymer transporter ExbD [Novipirellula galeiformis]TWU24153.1 biopolymer transport protein ExbD [Novipirellula galeiformis]